MYVYSYRFINLHNNLQTNENIISNSNIILEIKQINVFV